MENSVFNIILRRKTEYSLMMTICLNLFLLQLVKKISRLLQQ